MLAQHHAVRLVAYIILAGVPINATSASAAHDDAVLLFCCCVPVQEARGGAAGS